MKNLEMTIARKLVRKALAAGYMVSVYDGEEYAVKRSTKFTKIVEALASTSDDVLVLRTADGTKVGSVWLIWGNGEDLISDYTDNEATNALVKEFGA
jgi:hypothetical protein